MNQTLKLNRTSEQYLCSTNFFSQILVKFMSINIGQKRATVWFNQSLFWYTVHINQKALNSLLQFTCIYK